MIGGEVLVRRGLKEKTKDIDIVVSTEKEFTNLKNAFLDLGFKGTKPKLGYENMNTSEILVKDELRIDLFNEYVCGQFKLSEGMKKRAEKVEENNNIKVYFCSNEDIFLFKTMTEREGDIADCLSLGKEGLDWDSILDEIIYQIKESGRDVWVTWIGERLEILEKKGLEIPIMDKVLKLCKGFYDKLET